jgi:hypothetical protein
MSGYRWPCPGCDRLIRLEVTDPLPIHCRCGHTQHYWPADLPSRGLGDMIAKVTSNLGIMPCGGCKKRQEWLNRLRLSKMLYSNSQQDTDHSADQSQQPTERDKSDVPSETA